MIALWRAGSDAGAGHPRAGRRPIGLCHYYLSEAARLGIVFRVSIALPYLLVVLRAQTGATTPTTVERLEAAAAAQLRSPTQDADLDRHHHLRPGGHSEKAAPTGPELYKILQNSDRIPKPDPHIQLDLFNL